MWHWCTVKKIVALDYRLRRIQAEIHAISLPSNCTNDFLFLLVCVSVAHCSYLQGAASVEDFFV